MALPGASVARAGAIVAFFTGSLKDFRAMSSFHASPWPLRRERALDGRELTRPARFADDARGASRALDLRHDRAGEELEGADHGRGDPARGDVERAERADGHAPRGAQRDAHVSEHAEAA